MTEPTSFTNPRRFFRWRSAAALVLFGLLLGGCASTPRGVPQDADAFSVSFVYGGSFGVGPTPNNSTAVLNEGQELPAIRRAIRTALKSRQSGVTEEKESELTSDIVALSRQQVDEYNGATSPQFHLTNDREYGLAYVISFAIDIALIDLRIAALMSERGRNNPWRRLKEQRQYDSLYFTQSLAEDIQAALIQATTTEHSEP